jgi:hypothetical protein
VTETKTDTLIPRVKNFQLYSTLLRQKNSIQFHFEWHASFCAATKLYWIENNRTAWDLSSIAIRLNNWKLNWAHVNMRVANRRVGQLINWPTGKWAIAYWNTNLLVGLNNFKLFKTLPQHEKLHVI